MDNNNINLLNEPKLLTYKETALNQNGYGTNGWWTKYNNKWILEQRRSKKIQIVYGFKTKLQLKNIFLPSKCMVFKKSRSREILHKNTNAIN